MTKSKNKSSTYKYKIIFIAVSIVLIAAILAVFAIGTGKAVANGESEELKIRLYDFLEGTGYLTWISDIIFGDDIPSYASNLPPSVNSDTSKINVLFSDSSSPQIKEIVLTEENDGLSGTIIALNDPTALSIGSSTQKSNVLSEIMKVEHARLAFAFSDTGGDPVLLSDGEWKYSRSSELYGYLGFNEDGIMHFGTGRYEDIEELSLLHATKQNVYSLICGGVPCNFDMSKGAIGSASLSVAQCSDGSVLILFADPSASCLKITELLYRYSAVNAAIVYVGNGVGFADESKSVSYGSGFENAQHTSAWVIK